MSNADYFQLAASRMANTQPTYDFITAGSVSTPVQPLGQSRRQSRRQSTVVKPGASFLACPKENRLTGFLDIGNEDLRAQVKTLQYEVDSLKQERDLSNLRHDKELRDVQLKAEETFRNAQVNDARLSRSTSLISMVYRQKRAATISLAANMRLYSAT